MEEKLSRPQDAQISVFERLVHESSNGDKWYLERDPATGSPMVRHVANPQSGGHVSHLEVDTFLASGAGPELEALRRLLETESFATILIVYDIHPTHGPRYHDLANAIQSLGVWWHHLETVWIVRSDRALADIRDNLKAHIGADDQLLVIDISGVGAEWAGVNDAGSSWLKGNIARSVFLA